jgi:hypothetical protein
MQPSSSWYLAYFISLFSPSVCEYSRGNKGADKQQAADALKVNWGAAAQKDDGRWMEAAQINALAFTSRYMHPIQSCVVCVCARGFNEFAASFSPSRVCKCFRRSACVLSMDGWILRRRSSAAQIFQKFLQKFSSHGRITPVRGKDFKILWNFFKKVPEGWIFQDEYFSYFL